MDMALSEVSPSLIRGLAFTHCPALHVSPRIQQLSSLLILVLFNSTLVDWSDSAALIGRRHRQFAILLFVRVEFVEFPLGLLSPHFPLTLVDFKVHRSNLTLLSEETIEVFWSVDLQNFVVKHSKLTRVPAFLTKKQVDGTLSLAGNLITKVSLKEILATPCTGMFLGHKPLQRLTLPNESDTSTISISYHPGSPELASVKELHLEGSSVSSLPEWLINVSLSASGRTLSVVVLGNESPLCSGSGGSVKVSSDEATIVALN